MPYAESDGLHIHYQLEGDGPPLVLCHGSFGSLEDWYDFGYVAALMTRFQLVLLDARGHGRSGKPHSPSDYALKARASDILALLDTLGIGRADYFGYSMGGWIGFGLARYAPDRFRSLMLGGAHPYGEDMQAFRAMVPDDPRDFPSRLEPVYGVHLGPAMRERVAANDIAAIRALTADREDLSSVLPTMTMPCLLFAGSADPRRPRIEEAARAIQDATLFQLADCSHVAAWGRSDLVLPHLREFLDRL